MKDWRLMANAMDLGIPDEEFERISAALDKLEAVFRPLVAQLHPGVDSAITYIPSVESPE
jgi:hypothetical protein